RANSPLSPSTSSGPPTSLSEFCECLIRSRLLTDDEVHCAQSQWTKDGEETASLNGFGRWLAANAYLTEFQASMVSQGHIDGFFLGPYKVLNALGRGRHSLVFKTVHRLGRIVVLKILPISMAKDAAFVARFQNEVAQAVQLNHANVVRILGLGMEKGISYVMLEYLDGNTLQDVLDRRGRL